MKRKIVSKASCLMVGACMLFTWQAKSQISPHINADVDDLKMLRGRTMIVELMEEDPKIVDKLTKKNKTDELAMYRNFISTYNTDIKVAVDKYWTFNKKIEYKKKSELDKILGDSKDYVIMFYRELGDIDMDFASASRLSVPVIAYNRSERSQKKDPDEEIYLPPVAYPEKSVKATDLTYAQSSYNFAVREMQANIQYMIKMNKKIIYEDYACKMSDENKCKKLQQSNILILKSQLDPKSNIKDMKDAYNGPFQFVADKDFIDAFVNETDGKSDMFILPWGLAKGSIGPFSQTSLVFMKVIIDCKTGDVLYAHKAGMLEGEEMMRVVRPVTFEHMDKCKS